MEGDAGFGLGDGESSRSGLLAIPRVKVDPTPFGCNYCRYMVLPNDNYNYSINGDFICEGCVSRAIHDPKIEASTQCRYPLYKAVCEAGVYTCINIAKGCERKLSLYEIESHFKNGCHFTDGDRCFVTGCFMTLGNDPLEHFKIRHRVKSININPAMIYCCYDRPEKNTLNQKFQWISVIFHCFGTDIVLAIEENKHNWKMWLQLYDVQMNSRKFTAEVVIGDPGVTRVLNVNQYDQPVDQTKGVLVLPLEQVQKSLERFKHSRERCLPCKFLIQVEEVQDFCLTAELQPAGQMDKHSICNIKPDKSGSMRGSDSVQVKVDNPIDAESVISEEGEFLDPSASLFVSDETTQLNIGDTIETEDDDTSVYDDALSSFEDEEIPPYKPSCAVM